jgi:hypothetical protein
MGATGLPSSPAKQMEMVRTQAKEVTTLGHIVQWRSGTVVQGVVGALCVRRRWRLQLEALRPGMCAKRSTNQHGKHINAKLVTLSVCRRARRLGTVETGEIHG